MPTDQFNTNSTPLTTGPWAPWNHRLAVTTAIVFFVSSAFPIVVGLSKNTGTFPKWWGMLDVGLAFVLAMLAFAIMAVARGKVNRQALDASYRTYRVLTHAILAMCVIFFLAGDRIVWSNCLTGFAWRAWLLLYILPSWFTAFRPSQG
jgi:hypothetical protein